MNELIILAMAAKVGLFDCGQVSVDQSNGQATLTLFVDDAAKQGSPDITFTVYSVDSKGNRSVLTSGTVTPGPWTDKTGKLQASGADPSFGISGIKGMTLAVEASCSKSCTVSSSVTYDSGITKTADAVK